MLEVHIRSDTQASLIPRPLPSIARIDQVGGDLALHLLMWKDLGSEPGLGKRTRTWESNQDFGTKPGLGNEANGLALEMSVIFHNLQSFYSAMVVYTLPFSSQRVY